MQVDFRCFQNGDCYSDELLVFLKRLFQDIDKEKWVWEYCNAPNGSLVILTYCNKEIVGHYASLDYKFNMLGRVVDAGKAEGSLVDLRTLVKMKVVDANEVFSNSVKHFLAQKESEGCELIFGFPNAAALPAQNRAGYQKIDVSIQNALFFRNLAHFRQWKFPFSGMVASLLDMVWAFRASIACLRWQNGRTRIVNIGDVPSHDLDEFNRSFAQTYPEIITIHRSRDFYKWRFVDNPYTESRVLAVKDQSNNIIGVGAFSRRLDGTGTIEIQDLLALDIVALRRLIKVGLGWARECDAAGVELWVGDHPFHELVRSCLKEVGFLFGKRQEKRMIIWQKLWDERVVDARNWYVTMAFRRF